MKLSRGVDSRALRRRLAFFGFVLGWALLLGRPALGDLIAAKARIEGRVVHAVTGAPVEHAEVRIQTSLSDTAKTDADGRFTLKTTRAAGESIVVTAAATDDSGLHPAFYNDGTYTVVGANDVEIRLTPILDGDDRNYEFANPSTCSLCHLDFVNEFLTSPHKDAARNMWVRDVYDGSGTPGGSNGFTYKGLHPELNGDCAECHAPMQSGKNPGDHTNLTSDVTGDPLEFGVSCDVCHKTAGITNIKLPGVMGMEFKRGSAGADLRARQEIILGPHPDAVGNYFGVMRATYAPLLSQSLMCAACHEDNNDHDFDGDYLDEGSVPSEESFSEWSVSKYAVPGAGFKSCQDCHMPPTGSTAISPQYGPFGGITTRDVTHVRSHEFRGTTDDYVQNAGTVRLIANADDGRLSVWAAVTNDRAGHDLPGGIFLRHAILLVKAYDRTGNPLDLITSESSIVPEYGGVGDEAEGNFAGLAGKGFAKVFRNASQSNVFFTEATSIESDNRIPAGATDFSSYSFNLPEDGGPYTVSARLIYRRAFRSLMLEKNWTVTGHGRPNPDAIGPDYGTLMDAAEIETGLATVRVDEARISIADGLKLRTVSGSPGFGVGATIEVTDQAGAWNGFSQPASVKASGRSLTQRGRIGGVTLRKYWSDGEVRFVRITNPDGSVAVLRLQRDGLDLRPAEVG